MGLVWGIAGCLGAKSGDDAADDSSATEDTSAAESGSSDSGSAIPPCNRQETACGSDVPHFDCDSPSVCDPLVVHEPAEDTSDPLVFVNPEMATCILTALRDDVVATHSLQIRGGYVDSLWLEAFGDGTIVWRSKHWDDACFSTIETWAQRRDDAYFDACLEAADPATQYQCLLDSVDTEQCVEDPAVCP